MRRLGLMSFLLMFLACTSGAAATFPAVIDWEVGGKWSAYGYMDAAENNDAEDDFISDNRALWENDIRWEEQNVFVKADVEWRYETFHGMDTGSDTDLRFREVYGEIKGEQQQFSIGQQIVTWGKLDDLVVLDRIAPQDYTHFVLYDKQERKDPALMARHQWFGENDFQIETIFMPMLQPSELDFFGTNWSAFGYTKEVVNQDSVYTAGQKAAVAGISIQDDDRVTDQSLRNSQFALRARGRKAEVDYGVYYMNLYHTLPVLKESNPNGNLVKQFLYDPTTDHLNQIVGLTGDDLLLTESHPRINVIGADWETVMGICGLRGEMALLLGMPYLRDNFSYTEEDQVSFGFGIDHTTESDWYFDFQYVQDYILNYEGLFGMEQAPYQFAGTISKPLARGKIVMNLDWMWGAAYGDWMANPEIVYKWEKFGIDIAFGGFIFQEGNTNTLFGRYDSNDVVYVKVNGSF